MSDLVKTKFEIFAEIDETIVSGDKDEYKELILDKVLVLPSGLSVLEEMLKKEIEQAKVRQCEPFPPIEDDTYEYGSFDSLNHVLEMISSVFARFKQEYGIKEK